MNDPKVIWLAPECCGDERTWCEDNAWPDGCEDCGTPPVKYIRAPESEQPQMKADMK